MNFQFRFEPSSPFSNHPQFSDPAKSYTPNYSQIHSHSFSKSSSLATIHQNSSYPGLSKPSIPTTHFLQQHSVQPVRFFNDSHQIIDKIHQEHLLYSNSYSFHRPSNSLPNFSSHSKQNPLPISQNRYEKFDSSKKFSPQENNPLFLSYRGKDLISFKLPEKDLRLQKEINHRMQNSLLQEGMRRTITNPPRENFGSSSHNLHCLRDTLIISMQRYHQEKYDFRAPFSQEHYSHLLQDISRNWSWVVYERKPFHSTDLFSLPQSHLDQKILSFSVKEFSKGLCCGLPKGIYASGDHLASFATQIVSHPINTAQEIWQALGYLKTIITELDRKSLAEAFAPEILNLIDQWDLLSSKEKGESIGYIVGKYGTDLLLPGTLMKTAKLFRKANFFSQNISHINQLSYSKTRVSYIRLEHAKILKQKTTLYSKNISDINRSISLAGTKSMPLDYAPYQKIRNQPTTINGRLYSGHALDRMQDRGIMPSCIEETIEKGTVLKGKNPKTVAYYDGNNNITVVLNEKKGVITNSIGKINQ